MKLIVIVPNVVRRYVASFPEATNNAYNYFNYDNRVVEERVPRGDCRKPYIGPNEINDNDFETLVAFAKDNIDPYLAKYSMNVACDDSLSKAIRSFQNGFYDNKVNSSKYNHLLGELKAKLGLAKNDSETYRHSSAKKIPAKPAKVKEVGFNELKNLGGLKHQDIPMEHQVKHIPKFKGLVRTRGNKVIVKK